MSWSREEIERLESEVRKLKRDAKKLARALDTCIDCWPSLLDGPAIEKAYNLAQEKYL